jgi:hypothetical protein
MADDLTQAIIAEIATAIRNLGGDPATVDLRDTWAVNRVLEFLGADRYLLMTVGSWKDSQDEETTLRELKEWNAGGSLGPDQSFK